MNPSSYDSYKEILKGGRDINVNDSIMKQKEIYLLHPVSIGFDFFFPLNTRIFFYWKSLNLLYPIHEF